MAATACGRAEDAFDRALGQCLSCHGQAGRPGDGAIPVIWGQDAAYLAKQLNDYRDGGRDSQIMSSMAEAIPRARLAEAAARLAQKPWPDPAEPAALAPPSEMAQTCTACHGADLTGGHTDAGAAPRLAGQNERYLVDQMEAFASGERSNQPVMTALMRALDAAQRAALAREFAHATR